MTNRRGYIKVVEAVLAALIVVSALLLVSVQRERAIESQITERLVTILDEIARDNGLRGDIISDTTESSGAETAIESYFTGELGSGFEVVVLICELSGGCSSEEEMGRGEIYSAERVVSAVPGEVNPKRVRVWVWRK